MKPITRIKVFTGNILKLEGEFSDWATELDKSSNNYQIGLTNCFFDGSNYVLVVSYTYLLINI